MIVREINWAGPCIDRGPLVRETPQFYVYQAHGKSAGLRRLPRASI